MRRLINVAFAFALIGAACGGSDSTTTTTGGGGTSGTTSPPAATTTTEATATTEADPVAARIAAAEAFMATYEGEWNNTTFGSTGALTIEVTEVSEFGFMLIQMDVDGNAFGGADPDANLIEIDLVPDPPQILGSSLLGDALLEIGENGQWVVTATPPGLGLPFTAEVMLTEDGFEGTYVIENEDGSVFAEGTFSATRSG